MKEYLTNPIVVAIATAALMWVAGWVRQFLAKRVRLQNPDAKAIQAQGKVQDKLVIAVNTLIECKGPELDMLIALGDAMQGRNNGNVTDALKGARQARDTFERFKDKNNCIEVAHE
jgi:hypothetical protein